MRAVTKETTAIESGLTFLFETPKNRFRHFEAIENVRSQFQMVTEQFAYADFTGVSFIGNRTYFIIIALPKELHRSLFR